MSSEDALRMQYEAQLEEFRALKAEILANLQSGRQVVNLTLTAIGTLIAAVPFILDRNATIVFLLAPLLFYALAWTQLRYTFLAADMGTYLRKALIPSIRRSVLAARGTDSDSWAADTSLMGWEYSDASLLHSRRTRLGRLLILPIAGANYGVPLLASAGSVTGFFVASRPNANGATVVLFTALDAVLFGYSLTLGILAEIGRRGVDTRPKLAR